MQRRTKPYAPTARRTLNCLSAGVRSFLVCALALATALPVHGYSVLAHEAIIDVAWEKDIAPLLLRRFPNATPDDLVKAHAYAYGGAIIQDMGYYPFGSKFFSDLLHYVRSGDFIVNQLAAAQDLNEYAFALGSLAHYAADNQGHSVAVNPSVGVEYPKLARKFGPLVTYADDSTSHLRVEFSFDVVQVGRKNYAPQAYHDFIGFEVSKDLLNRAFVATYGLQLTDVFSNLDLALGSYRRAVGGVIPDVTRASWRARKKELRKATPQVDSKKFVYNVSRASYEKEWGDKYQKPGFGTRLLTFVIRILPKIGPLKVLAFKPPTPQTTKWFEDSFDKTLDDYRRLLVKANDGQLQIENRNFDTGQPTRPAQYRLADDAYATLAVKLADKSNGAPDPKTVADILAYFHDTSLPFATKADAKDWQKTLAALDKLKASAHSDAARSQTER
jgi:hypothetical protein